jgi:hypothetical protein
MSNEFIPIWASFSRPPVKPEPVVELTPIQVDESTVWTEPVIEQQMVTEMTRRKGRRPWDHKLLASLPNLLPSIESEWKPLFNQLGFAPGSDQERTGFLLIYGFHTQDSVLIRRFTKWPKQWVNERVNRARKNRIWLGNNKIRAKWLTALDKGDDTLADTEMVVAVMVMNGDMVQQRGRYRLSDAYYGQIKGADFEHSKCG